MLDDLWVVISFSMLLIFSVIFTHHERTLNAKHDNETAARLECESQMTYIFLEGEKLTERLKRCEKRRQR